jgi:hypothetical protein
MSATAPELVERAHVVVERLASAMAAGGSAVHLQLICSELFEALQAELGRISASEAAKKELLLTALDLCKRSAEPTLGAPLRLAQVRATVALLQGGLPRGPAQGSAGQPRLRVVQGGLA